MWSDGTSQHRGAIVENAVAIEFASNPELALVGKVSGNEVKLRLEAVGGSEKLAGAELIWLRSDGNGTAYAIAYVSRALANFQEGNWAKVAADTTAALRRDPDLTTAFSLRSQLCSSCPDATFRDGAQAILDAERYCQLTASDPTDQWVCHALRAAAHAENRDFAKAVQSAKVALDAAPSDVQDQMRKRLEIFQSGKPLRVRDRQSEITPQ